MHVKSCYDINLHTTINYLLTTNNNNNNNNNNRRMDYTETCTPLGSPAGLVGAQMGVKTPLAHYGGA